MNRYLIITGTGFMENMKKSAAVTMTALFVITCVSCAGTGTTGSSSAGNNASWINCEAGDFTEGWCNENTYRIRVTGSPPVKSKTAKDRKSGSKKAAILAAQNRILEKFKDMGIDINYAEVDTKAYELAIEIKKAVKNGKIISEKWDDNQNCEIIYEVSIRRLKKKVENSVFN